MHVHVILKGEAGQELKTYKFLFHQYDFNVIIWHDSEWKEVLDRLYSEVKPYSIWKLVIADTSLPANKKEDELFSDMEELLKDSFFITGRENRRPPQKIYILIRRNAAPLSGYQGGLMAASMEAPASTRFFLMDCEEYSYLQEFEKLKIICAAFFLGQNELPAEVSEAYYVHRIQLDINERKMKKFLEYSEEIFLRRIDDLRKTLFHIERQKEKGAYVVYDYMPEISVSKFEELKIKHTYQLLKHKNDFVNWYMDVGDISAGIERHQREQKSIHKRMRAEMNQRLDMLENTELYLDEQQKKEIKEQMEQKREELLPYYAESWKLKRRLLDTKEQIEKQMEYLIGKRKSWGDVGKIILFMELLVLFSFFPFSVLYLFELQFSKTLRDLGFMVYEQSLDTGTRFAAVTVLSMGIMIPVILISLIIAEDNLRTVKKEYKGVLDEINCGFQYNYDKCKNFFSISYCLRSFQNILLRNRKFEKNKKRIKDSLHIRIREQQQKYDELQSFKGQFSSFIDENIKDEIGVETREEEWIRGGGKDLGNFLPFIERITIVKETHLKDAEKEKDKNVT